MFMSFEFNKTFLQYSPAHSYLKLAPLGVLSEKKKFIPAIE
jgi:hypothetical protein